MGQSIFFGLFIIALFAGAFAYFVPVQKPADPMKFMMDNSGFNPLEMINHKRSEQINMTMNKGIMQIRRKMDDLALEQNKFLDVIRDQQQLLKNTGKGAADIMLAAEQEGERGNQDILRLKALASQMQDEQHLLVARGQDLIALNDRLTQNRQLMADRIDLAKINTETSLRTLRDRYDSLKDQVSRFFDKVNEHNQEVRDRMDKMREHLRDFANNRAFANADQKQRIKDRIQLMLDKEHEDMIRLADSEERSRNLLHDAQERQKDSKELLNDKLQQNQDLIEQEHQKAQDQQEINRQHMADQLQRSADQMQRIRDRQNR